MYYFLRSSFSNEHRIAVTNEDKIVTTVGFAPTFCIEEVSHTHIDEFFNNGWTIQATYNTLEEIRIAYPEYFI